MHTFQLTRNKHFPVILALTLFTFSCTDSAVELPELSEEQQGTEDQHDDFVELTDDVAARDTMSDTAPVNCLALSREQCQAAGCSLFDAYPLGDELCHGDELAPAFCRAEPDVLCAWEGYPIIMTEPDGSEWYADWSCFTTPEGWQRQEVPDGLPSCSQELDCFAHGVEDCPINGCMITKLYPLDAQESCFEEPIAPAFCAPAVDIDCDWGGPPVRLHDPTGAAWYWGDGCFDSPPDWQRENLSEALLPCDLPCIMRDVDTCEAAGCELFLAYPYDAQRDCHEESLAPAFCRADPDVICGWEGEPVIMTQPDGTQWYADWSCFTRPSDWAERYVPEGVASCAD
ncbi:MAG: hypothetical protein RBU37_12450 [Myxococcota bacterium]|jgi:hypothetical protein|nr:hypothetical protein [Myxococcota bacterium]